MKNNQEKVKKYKKKWRLKNPSYPRKWAKKMYNENDIYKLSANLRGRLRAALKNDFKTGSAVQDLGCSIAELKLYLKERFTFEMTWENHGTYWHIDHIKPLSKFDLTDRQQFLEACHYTNLQPLFWHDNLTKWNK